MPLSIGKKVAWNTLVQFAGKLVNVSLAIVTLGLLMRYLGTEQFGWYTTVISFLQVFGIIADFGLVIVTAQMLTEFSNNPRMYGNILGFRIVTAFAIIGLAPLLVWFFPYPLIIKQGVIISAAAFISIALQQVATGVFQRHLAMHINVLGEFVNRVILLIGILLVTTGNLGFIPALFVIVLASIVQLVIYFIGAKKFVPLTIYFDAREWKIITHRVAPITLGILFNVIYLRGDILALTLLRPQTEVGLYGAAYRVLDIITQVPIMYMGVVLPLITAAWIAHDTLRIQRILSRSAHFFLLIATPIIVGGMMLATPIMKLVGGVAFADAGSIATVLFLALAGGFAGALYGHAIVAMNKQREALWIYAFVAVIGVVGYIIAIPLYGMWGAAWVSVGTETLAGALLWYKVRKETGVSTNLSRIILKIMLAAIGMAIALYFVRSLPVILAILVGAAVYSIAILALLAVSKQDLALLVK